MAEKYLSQIYYDPESPASFGGVDSIYCAVKNEGNMRYRGIKYANGYKSKIYIA
jgi:hypothetical protein